MDLQLSKEAREVCKEAVRNAVEALLGLESSNPWVSHSPTIHQVVRMRFLADGSFVDVVRDPKTSVPPSTTVQTHAHVRSVLGPAKNDTWVIYEGVIGELGLWRHMQSVQEWKQGRLKYIILAVEIDDYRTFHTFVFDAGILVSVFKSWKKAAQIAKDRLDSMVTTILDMACRGNNVMKQEFTTHFVSRIDKPHRGTGPLTVSEVYDMTMRMSTKNETRIRDWTWTNQYFLQL